MDQTLRYQVEFTGKIADLETANAEMAQLRAQNEQLNTSAQARVSIGDAMAEADAAPAAQLEQQLAIQTQLQVIAETRLELAAAAATGNDEQVALLNSELKVRTSVLGVMRAEVLTAAELNALTEKEAVLLAASAKETGALAGSALVAGMNLNRTKGEAVTLAREIATGSVNARTLGALLGSLGTTLTIAGLAGYELFQLISHSGDEAVKLADEAKKETDELARQVTQWQELAKAAGDFQDVLKLDEKIEPQLEKILSKLKEFQNKKLTPTEKFEDLLPPAQPFNPDGSEKRQDANQEAKEAAIKSQLQLLQQAILAEHALTEEAKTASDTWQQLKLEPLNDAINTQSDNVEKARTKYAELEDQLKELTSGELDEAKSAQLVGVYKNLNVSGRDLELQIKRLNELEEAEKKEAAATERDQKKTQQIEINDLLKQEENLLRQIRGDQQVISSDPSLAAEAQRDQLHNLALKEQAQVLLEIHDIENELAKLEALHNPELLKQIDGLNGKLTDLRTKYQLLGQEIKKTTPGGDFQASLASWVNSYGTAAHQIAQTIQSAVGGSLQSLNQYIVTGQGNVQQLMQSFEMLGLQLLEQMAIQEAAQLFHITTITTAQTASGASIAAAHAPAAAATSISSYGYAALIGAALAIAAIAAIEGAFHEGGVSGASRGRRGRTGPLGEDEHLSLLRDGEVILTPEQAAHTFVSPHATQQFSSEQLEAMAGAPRFHDGGSPEPTPIPGNRPPRTRPGQLAPGEIPIGFDQNGNLIQDPQRGEMVYNNNGGWIGFWDGYGLTFTNPNQPSGQYGLISGVSPASGDAVSTTSPFSPYLGADATSPAAAGGPGVPINPFYDASQDDNYNAIAGGPGVSPSSFYDFNDDNYNVTGNPAPFTPYDPFTDFGDAYTGTSTAPFSPYNPFTDFGDDWTGTNTSPASFYNPYYDASNDDNYSVSGGPGVPINPFYDASTDDNHDSGATLNTGGTDIANFGGDVSLGADVTPYHDYESTPISPAYFNQNQWDTGMWGYDRNGNWTNWPSATSTTTTSPGWAPPPFDSSSESHLGSGGMGGLAGGTRPPTAGEIYAAMAAAGYSMGPMVSMGRSDWSSSDWGGTGGGFAAMVSGRYNLQLHDGGAIGPQQTDPFLAKLFNLQPHEVPAVLLDTEYVMPPEAHALHGTRGMDLIKNMRVPIDRIALHDGGPASSSSLGGRSSGGAGGGFGGDVKLGMNAFFDIPEMMRKIQASDDHKKFIWDVVRGRVHELGLRV